MWRGIAFEEHVAYAIGGLVVARDAYARAARLTERTPVAAAAAVTCAGVGVEATLAGTIDGGAHRPAAGHVATQAPALHTCPVRQVIWAAPHNVESLEGSRHWRPMFCSPARHRGGSIQYPMLVLERVPAGFVMMSGSLKLKYSVEWSTGSSAETSVIGLTSGGPPS